MNRRSLAELTSFRIGGPADALLEVESEDELRAAMAAAWCERVPAFCLGAGTNLLVSDRGVRGLVVRLGEGFTRLDSTACGCARVRPRGSGRWSMKRSSAA